MKKETVKHAIFFASGILLIVYAFLPIILAQIKLTKSDIAGRYGYAVDRRTLRRWIDFLGIHIDLEGKRKISLLEWLPVLAILGNPFTFPSLSRADIRTLISCNKNKPISNPTLRKYLNFDKKHFPDESKIKELRIFPPSISKNILERNEVSTFEIYVYLEKNQKKIPFLIIY